MYLGVYRFEGEAAAMADEAEALAFAELYAAAPAPLRSRLGLRIAGPA